jgi:hypothetical protein
VVYTLNYTVVNRNISPVTSFQPLFFNQPSGLFGDVPVSTKMSPLRGFENSLVIFYGTAERR